MPVDRDAVLAWFTELQRAYALNSQRLTELDAAIGDADHGSNMERGFTAVQAELDKAAPASIAAIFKAAAATLIKTVGGASGPLYGTFFLRAAATCQDRAELDAGGIAAVFRAGIQGVVERGKAAPGDKTMLDSLLPALEAMENGQMLSIAADAAERGMLATIPMQARKGRASYLGVRSVGHQDPGATSSYLLIRAASDAWKTA